MVESDEIANIANNVHEIAKTSIVMICCYTNETPSILNPFDVVDDMSKGTGFFIDNEHILTNHHVIEDAKTIHIKVIGLKHLINVEVLWVQPYLDYAILRQVEKQYTPRFVFPHGTSKTLHIGDPIEVIGYPLAGYYNNLKLYRGSVNGWERNKLQHDTNVNPGTSGSPIIHDGKVVGLHKEGHTAMTGNIMFGATIESLKLDRVLSLKQHGFIHIPYFPFDYQCIDKSHREYLKWKYYLDDEITGVIINGGTKIFQPKDILLKINEFHVTCDGEIDFHQNGENYFSIKHLTSYMIAGEKITLKILRLSSNNTYEEIKLKVKTLGPTVGKKIKVSPDTLILRDIIIQDISNELSRKIQYSGSLQGPIITYVYDYTESYNTDFIESGSVIASVNQKPVKNVEDIKRELLNSSIDNNFIVLETLDLVTIVFKKTDILKSMANNFTRWKVPLDSFYTELQNTWSPRQKNRIKF